ncbi:MAG: molybdate ABC transporter permease subunit [Propionibacteriaceae bacterium]|nr:molybdate ABC transporter permease subunit [Propionibacteriaceae bacterium]
MPRTTRSASTVPPWALVLCACSLVMLVAPVLALTGQSDWEQVWAAARSRVAVRALVLSFETSALAALICALLGIPASLALARRPRQSVLHGLILLPLVLPPMVSGLALLTLLGKRGLLGPALGGFGISLPFTTAAVVIAQVFVGLPFLVLNVESALRAHGQTYEWAAAGLGSSPTRTFFRITIPLVSPALRSGLALCFARALGEFGATALFAGNMPGVTQTMPLAIYTAFNGGGDSLGTAVALALELVIVAIILMAVATWKPRHTHA